jgi:hypothetical protein
MMTYFSVKNGGNGISSLWFIAFIFGFLTILSVAKNSEWIMNWKDRKGSSYGLIYSPSQHYWGRLRETTQKSLRKLSLSWDLNLKHPTYEAGRLILLLFTNACTQQLRC